MRDRHSNGYYDDEEEGYVDEYEDEEQEEMREPPKQTREEKEFLSIRERLKEKFRQKLLKERASTFGRSSLHDTPKTPSQNKFGSFFGPSLPGIAPRVIEETKAIKETQHLQSSSKPLGASTTKGAASLSSRPKPSNGHTRQPKLVSQVKRKAEILKDNRDYSFLFSDDADVPHEPSTKTSSYSKSDWPSTSQPPSAILNKEPSRGHPPGPTSRSAPSTGGPTAQRHAPTTQRHPQQQRQRLGPIAQRHAQQQHQRLGPIAQRQPQQQNQQPGASRQSLPQSNKPRPSSNGAHRTGPSTVMKAPTTAVVANKAPMRSVNGTNNHHTVVKKNPMHAASSVQRHPTEHKRMGPVPSKPSPKQAPPSKPQPSKQMASSANGRIREHENKNVTVKKKPAARGPFDDDDDDNAIDLIRKMFNYNPNRWAGRDEDDSDMEVGFDVIQKEERRSSKIARKEDEEQLRLIEEEERREHMRKKQKLRHG